MQELFTNLADYFAELYSFNYIVNFNMTDVGRMLPLMIIGCAVGIFLATCASYYNGQFLGSVVRGLYKANAFDEATAVTLAEVGCDKKALRRAIAKHRVLSKYVKAASGDRFYIPEADKYVADKRFKAVPGGKLTLVVAFFLCLIGGICLLDVVPEVIQLADNAIGMIKA